MTQEFCVLTQYHKKTRSHLTLRLRKALLETRDSLVMEVVSQIEEDFRAAKVWFGLMEELKLCNEQI